MILITQLYHSIQLRKLLPHANKSRKTIAAATSNLESGAMQLWHEEFAIDTGLLAKIGDEMPTPESNNESPSHKELEQKIIDIHHLQSQIDQLSTKSTQLFRKTIKYVRILRTLAEPQ